MAAQFDCTCKSCGGEHSFCLPDSDLIDGNAEYEFTCPKTQDTVRLKTDQFAQVVPGCNKSSVVLHRVP